MILTNRSSGEPAELIVIGIKMTTKDYKGISTKMAKDSLEMSDEDLLRDLYHQYDIAFSKNDPAQINRTIAYFSTLLIKLSRQAEESTKENIKMQRTITKLTWAMLVVSIVLFFVSIAQITIQIKQNNNQLNDQPKRQEHRNQIQGENKPVPVLPQNKK